MLRPTVPIIIPISLPSDLSAIKFGGFTGLVGGVFITVVVGGCSGSKLDTHVKFLISRI
jgi:hypothetical protein